MYLSSCILIWAYTSGSLIETDHDDLVPSAACSDLYFEQVELSSGNVLCLVLNKVTSSWFVHGNIGSPWLPVRLSHHFVCPW